MKKSIAVLLSVAAVSALALEPVAWNGFWDTTAYVNAEPAAATVACEVSISLCFSDTAVSDSPAWFETLLPGYLLFLR